MASTRDMSHRARLVAAAMVWAAVTGCTPHGTSGGRIDVYDSSRDLRGGVQPAALYEFCDQTAEALALDISQLPAVKSATTRLVLELGGIENHTRTPRSDFEMIQKRLRGQLCTSKLVTERFMIVQAGSRMDREYERIQGVGGQGDAPARYDPKVTYVLLGDFYEADRRGSARYYFQFTLTSLATREIVFQKSFDLGQRR